VRRSFRALATSLAAFLLTLAVPAGPALAATAQVVSPASDTTVGASKITVQVQANEDGLFDNVDSVRVRLSMNGTDTAAGTQDVAATCVSGCGNAQQVWVVEVDPMTFAPFGTPSAGRCNGGWWLQASVNGGAYGQGVQVVRSIAPSAPSDLTATGGVEEISLEWTRAPEPDVVGYLVERRQGTDSWTTVTTLGASADRYLDDVVAGTWTYRVISLRGDGRTSGGAATPCTDTGADLASASTTATAEAKPVKTSSGGSTTTGGTTDGTTTDGGSTDGGSTDGTTDGGTTDGGASDGTDGDGTDGTDATDGTGGDAETDGGATGDTTPTRRVGPRQAAPPPVDSAPNFSGSLNVGSQDPVVAKERYYGDDDEYSDTMDFGDAEVIAGEDLRGGSETRTIRVPGALQTVFGEELDVMRLVGSIASGLILITFGAHLRRWMRAGVVD